MKKFEFDIQSGYSADQVFEKAMTHKKELHVSKRSHRSVFYCLQFIFRNGLF